MKAKTQRSLGRRGSDGGAALGLHHGRGPAPPARGCRGLRPWAAAGLGLRRATVPGSAVGRAAGGDGRAVLDGRVGAAAAPLPPSRGGGALPTASAPTYHRLAAACRCRRRGRHGHELPALGVPDDGLVTLVGDIEGGAGFGHRRRSTVGGHPVRRTASPIRRQRPPNRSHQREPGALAVRRSGMRHGGVLAVAHAFALLAPAGATATRSPAEAPRRSAARSPSGDDRTARPTPSRSPSPTSGTRSSGARAAGRSDRSRSSCRGRAGGRRLDPRHRAGHRRSTRVPPEDGQPDEGQTAVDWGDDSVDVRTIHFDVVVDEVIKGDAAVGDRSPSP